MKTLIFLVLTIEVFAATNTNQNTRPTLNGHQQFYTNWVAQYSVVRKIVETNNAQITRHALLLAQIPHYHPRTRSTEPERVTQEYAAASAAHQSLQKSAQAARQRFQTIVNQRLAYELKFPAAIPYGPQIPKWTEPPPYKSP